MNRRSVMENYMSTQVLTVDNDKVKEATARAKARGATDVKVEALNGKSKLTITYPPIDEDKGDAGVE
jgi:hypothetical protein